MSTGKRQNYSSAYKIAAVRLVTEEGRSASEVSRELGIHSNLLHKWKQDYQKDQGKSLVGKGHVSGEQQELDRLRKEVRRLEQERDILKKAVSIFTQGQR